MLTLEDQRRVADAITAAEAKTSGEIVAVIAERSGSHALFALMYAALAALLVPWPLIYLTWWPMQWVFGLQLVVFLLLAVTLNIGPMSRWIVPPSLQKSWGHRRAVEQFLTQNMHTTRGRTGVMIFVSVAEHYAEIIADTAIYGRVDRAHWQAIVDELVSHLAADRPAEAFLSAIESSGKLLAENFPKGAGLANELPNHLIVLR
jgi:putative membrane protein